MSTMQRLHLRCGTDIQQSLVQARLDGEFLEWGEPVCLGPVANHEDEIDADDEAALARQRATFLAAYLALPRDDVQMRLDAMWQGFDRLVTYDEVALWFEHDAYDQLILLDFLRRWHRRGFDAQRLRLITTNYHPSTPRFIGLGQLEASALAELFAARVPVSPQTLAMASEVWKAFVGDDPLFLIAKAQSARAFFPFLPAALARYLAEYPADSNGLGLSQRLALTALARGAMSARALFDELNGVSDPQPYCGDQMFWPMLAALAEAPYPALAGNVHDQDALLHLTALGEKLVAGQADWTAVNGCDLHLGGVKLGNPPKWRWSVTRNTVVAA